MDGDDEEPEALAEGERSLRLADEGQAAARDLLFRRLLGPRTGRAGDLGEGEFEGLLPEHAAAEMDSWGADVIGVNCCDGPQGVFEAAKRMSKVTDRPLSAMPNAGLPQMVQGRLLYLASPEYMAEYARRYAQLGVALIGGCCGTTPDHIREMKRFLKAMKPAARGTGRAEAPSERPPVVHAPAPTPVTPRPAPQAPRPAPAPAPQPTAPRPP